MTIRLLVLVGPTACGKTGLAVDLAHAIGSEIVSADSRQVYRGLDIGSGKDLDEYRRVSPPVPYHLIDVADPRTVYSVFRYQEDCYRLLREKAGEPRYAEGLPLLLVGGTGLYVEAVLRGFRIANVPEDAELRDRLMRRDHDDLLRELEQVDSELAGRTDCSSKKRVVRALEIAHHARTAPVRYSEPPPVAIERAVFVVDLPHDALERRIEARLHARFEQGLIDEVRGLLDAGVTPERMNLLGLEYREVTAYLTGAKSEPQMRHDLLRGIRRLAKRQRTWFRGLPRRGIDVEWIRPDETDRLLGHEWLRGHVT